MRQCFLFSCLALAAFGMVGMGCSSNPVDGGSGGIQDAADRFFVDSARGNDGNAGRRDTPLKTLQEGINRAAPLEGSVFAAGGAYDETITLASNVEIHGGYDPTDWTEDRENFPSTISGGTTAVIGDGVTGVLLEGFIIISEDATEAGSSSIAVKLNDSTDVAIQEAMLFPGSGAAGADGADGENQNKGVAGGNGSDAAACTGSIAGGAGAEPFGSGQFSAGDGGSGNLAGGGDGEDGNQSAILIAGGGSGGAGGGIGQDGTDGTDGTDGADGGPGAGGAEVGTLDDGEYVPAAGQRGRPGEHGGSGGGGGGGGGAIVFACGGSGGGGGGGARPGGSGDGGDGGGASIGILLANSTDVRVSDCEISTGDGGNGGAGGMGGSGGIGGNGGTGGDRFAAQGAGGDGGDGGDGGNGGDGGGGGGGPVIGIAEDANSQSTQTNTAITLGTPGAGGTAPGGPDFDGAEGLAMDVFQSPE